MSIPRRVISRRANQVVLSVMTVVGLILVWAIHDARLGTYLFLAFTAIQGWLFTGIYGTKSTWRATAASRALFWIIFTYTLVATQILVTGLLHYKPEWMDDVRQLLYMGLTLAGLNLLLTMVRLVAEKDSDES